MIFFTIPSYVAYECIEGEVFIINTLSGLYFVAEGYAAMFWNALTQGYSKDQIAKAVVSAGLFDKNDEVLEKFFALLLSEKLIIEDTQNKIPVASALYFEKNLAFFEPSLSKYEDLQKLIAADPIHDVSETQGWPFLKEENHG